MKRMRAALFVLMGLLVLLSGCGASVNTPTTPDTVPADTQPQEQISIVEVDQNVVYFSNQLEYGRLYSIRTDGTQLKLIADVYTYNVQQVEDSVYFMADGDVCAYDIPSGITSVLIRNAFDYTVDGDHLVYFRDSKEYFLTEVRHYDLRTGEDVLIEEINFGGNCSAANGQVYYNRYDMVADKSYLCMCDLQTLQVHIIGADLDSYYRLFATDEGLYFEGADENYTYSNYFAPADGSAVCKLDVAFTDSCQMFCISGDTVLCTHTDYNGNGTIASIHRHNPDGTVTQLMQSEAAGYFHTIPLHQDLWLLEYTDYGGWSTEETAEEEYFVFLYEYYLIDADGNITPIDVTGELGRMFPDGDFPVMDSSTARKPVAAEIYSLFVANYEYEGAKPLCSTTHGAWLNIADRKADIALLAAPTDEEMDYLKKQGVSIEMKLYGGDGLVFIGNSANPVQNLTHEQLIAIYQGKITNWSELGGPDKPITVYYRDDQSGSQRLFEKMVFKGLELPDYEKLGFAYMDDMSTIVEIVMADPYSIGYSIMTYLDDVYDNDSVKVFAVNGVIPSVDTVKDSSYPYHTQGYVVIRSDEPEGSPARRLYDWFGSSVCDEILIANGITPLHDENGIG